jgi:murein L,D-transpeptidase YafK
MTLPLLASAIAAVLTLAPLSEGHAMTDSTRIAGAKAPKPAANALGFVADSVVVEKKARRLTLYSRGEAMRVYRVALGKNPVGDKVRQGDNRTPEGLFRIDHRNPNSKFYLALHISYPDSAHQARAAKLGVAPGGDIMIHGLPAWASKAGPSHRQDDWTEGCVALTNQEIEEIWSVVPVGTRVHIKP